MSTDKWTSPEKNISQIHSVKYHPLCPSSPLFITSDLVKLFPWTSMQTLEWDKLSCKNLTGMKINRQRRSFIKQIPCKTKWASKAYPNGVPFYQNFLLRLSISIKVHDICATYIIVNSQPIYCEMHVKKTHFLALIAMKNMLNVCLPSIQKG